MLSPTELESESKFYQVSKSFMTSIRTGDLNQINTLINEGTVDVNEEYIAASCFKPGHSKALPTFTLPPLQEAITANKKEVVACLLKAGADPLKVNPAGLTPLLLACSQPSRNTVGVVTELLKAAGTNINAQCPKGLSALHRVMNEAVATFLLEKGADIHITNNEGLSPLEYQGNKAAKEGFGLWPLALAFTKKTLLENPAAEKPDFFAAQKPSSLMNRCWNNCKLAVDKMKNEKILGTDYSIFDLHQETNRTKLAKLCKNPGASQLQSILEEDNARNYSYFSAKLKANLAAGFAILAKQKALASAVDYMPKNSENKLTENTIRIVLDYLPTEKLQEMAAAKLQEEQKKEEKISIRETVVAVVQEKKEAATKVATIAPTAQATPSTLQEYKDKFRNFFTKKEKRVATQEEQSASSSKYRTQVDTVVHSSRFLEKISTSSVPSNEKLEKENKAAKYKTKKSL